MVRPSNEAARGNRSGGAGDLQQQIARIVERVEGRILIDRQVGMAGETELGRHIPTRAVQREL